MWACWLVRWIWDYNIPVITHLHLMVSKYTINIVQFAMNTKTDSQMSKMWKMFLISTRINLYFISMFHGTHYIYHFHCLFWLISVRENRRGNQEWTFQGHWQYWIHKTQETQDTGDTRQRQTKQKIQYRKLRKRWAPWTPSKTCTASLGLGPQRATGGFIFLQHWILKWQI